MQRCGTIGEGRLDAKFIAYLGEGVTGARMEHRLVTSLAKNMAKALIAFVMLFAVSMPAMAELQHNVGAATYAASSSAALTSAAAEPQRSEGQDDQSSGSDVCHVGHCAHDLSMPASVTTGSAQLVVRPIYVAPAAQRPAVQPVRGLKRPPRI